MDVRTAEPEDSPVARDGARGSLFGRTLTLHQPARGQGYRVNVDAVLLASFAGYRHARSAVDLGAGVGAVGLSLLYRSRADYVVFVEKEASLSDLAASNLAANGWGHRGHVCCADVGDGFERAQGFDLIVCNPPYVTPGRGRPPVVASGARMGNVDSFVTAARDRLGQRGRACFAYPARELLMLTETLRRAGLEPKRLRLVHGAPCQAARIALVEAVAGKPGGLVVHPPLIETEAGKRTAELLSILAPNAVA